MKRTDITAIFPDATEDQIKTLMAINGADITNARKGAEDLQTQLDTANQTINDLRKGVGDFEAAQANATKFEKELNDLKAANALRDTREKVSKATGVPAALLTGATEDDCMAQANAIKEYARPSTYPAVPDGGEAGGIHSTEPRDDFADWFNKQI